MSKDSVKSCLVITYGPVPTPQYQTVEGGGMRAWGLADGLTSHGIDVTVGVNNSFPQELDEHEGVRLVNWGLDADFGRLLNSFDAVIISYCMGDPSVFVADNISDDVLLILDVYVPIYIEVSARESKDVDVEYVNYAADVRRHNHTLRRGDFFLYANDSQELLYSGVLSALGVINPFSYRQKRLLKTPFGIHRLPAVAKTNPYTPLGIKPNDFVVLWFGGIYPWFRIEEYLAAIKQLAKDAQIKFVFVGGKNPFNPNPDFSRQYDTALTFAKDNSFTNKSVFFVDWVDFNDRVDYFKHADVVVSLNQPGEENKYSWRTRVMDFVWGNVATISNGGDPLSEELIADGAAIRLPDLSAKSLEDTIRSVKRDTKLLAKVHKQLEHVQKRYYWDVVTTELASVLAAGIAPYKNEAPLRGKINTAPSDLTTETPVSVSQLYRVASLPLKVARKVRQKGVLRTAKIAFSVIKTQAKQQPARHRKPQFVFISHPLNNTGAPIVLLQIIEEYVNKYGANRVRVISPGAEKEQKEQLRKLGIRVEQAVFGVGFRFIRLQLALQKDDFVLMNTAAIYDNYRDFILLWLRTGRLKHAYWFIHEDIAQLPIVHKEFLDKRNLANMRSLTNDRKLSLIFPSKRTASEYNDLIETKLCHSINLRVEVDGKFIPERKASDFDTINFYLSGTSGDGRKGQLLALAAFYEYVKEYRDKHSENYREFKLYLIAVGTQDYISQQIRWISESQLQDNVVIYDSMPKDDALTIASNCNTVICCSLNETFGLYIAEGMLMGHIVLRNDCAGKDEQLVEGVNGFYIDHRDLRQFSAVLEQMLNKKSTSNQKLLEMSRASMSIMQTYTDASYLEQIEKID